MEGRGILILCVRQTKENTKKANCGGVGVESSLSEESGGEAQGKGGGRGDD